MKPAWTIPVLLAGLVLMIAGPWLAGALLPASAVLSDAEVKALNDARTDMHASLQSPGGPAGTSAASADEAYQSQSAAGQAALSRRAWLMTGTRLLGVAIAGVGIAGYLMGRRK